MTWDKFTMYLATIPDYSSDEEPTGDNQNNSEPKVTGSFNLFDMAERFKNRN